MSVCAVCQTVFQTQRYWVWPQVTMVQGLLGTSDFAVWVLFYRQASDCAHEGLKVL